MRVRESVNRIVQLLTKIFRAWFPRMLWLEASREGLLCEVVSRQGKMHIQPVRWVSPQGGWQLSSDGYSRGDPGLRGGGGLVAAGMGRGVASLTGPNPQVAGQGFARLQAAGIAVEIGDGAAQARLLNLGFLQRMETGRPWLRAKVAASMDGFTALPDGQSQWIIWRGREHV